MQDSGTTPLQSPGFLGALTTVHFVIIAILAVLAIIGILYGMKLSRERRAATRELEDAGHLERTGDAPSEPVAPPAPTRVEPVAPVVQEPVAPVVEEPVAQGMPEPVTTPLEQSVVPSEPPVVAAEPARAPFVETAAPVVPATPAGTDLTRLKGLGPKVAAMLVEQGIPDIATLARLQPGEADAVAARLGTFAPRLAKDRWVEQARYLAAGDIAGFEAVFGKL